MFVPDQYNNKDEEENKSCVSFEPWGFPLLHEYSFERSDNVFLFKKKTKVKNKRSSEMFVRLKTVFVNLSISSSFVCHFIETRSRRFKSAQIVQTVDCLIKAVLQTAKVANNESKLRLSNK